MIYERVHTIKTKRLISKYSIKTLPRSRYEFQRNLRNISAAVIPAATACPHKKGAAKLLQRLSQQSRLPPTGNKRLVSIVTLPSTGISQKLLLFRQSRSLYRIRLERAVGQILILLPAPLRLRNRFIKQHLSAFGICIL